MHRSTYAVYYHNTAYKETKELHRQQSNSLPQGLMGREVAGASFLRSLLRYSSHERVSFLLAGESERDSLTRFCSESLSNWKHRRYVKVIAPDANNSWATSSPFPFCIFRILLTHVLPRFEKNRPCLQ